ncbi:MAG: glycosyltransferase family 39 protein [Acidimicrobiia bacterium]
MSRRVIESFGAGALTVVVGLGALPILTNRYRALALLAIAAGAVAVLVWIVPRGLSGGWFRLGAAAVGLVALAPKVIASDAGVGRLQISGMVIAGVIALLGPVVLTPLKGPLPRWTVAASVIVLTIVMIWIVVGGGGLGHDESAYALKARAWLAGTPATGWGVHRAIGQSILAVPVLLFTDRESALRSLSLILSVGTVLAIGWLGRTVRSARVGLIAAGVFAVAPSFMRRGTEFLTDVPSAGLLVVVTAMLWRWGRSENSERRLLLGASAVAALAFYMRYQAVLSLGLLAVAAAIVFWPKVRESVGQILGAAALFLALLVPHFVWSTLAMGAPWSVLLRTGEVAGRQYLGEGLVDYVRAFPDTLAGRIGALAILVAIGWLVVRMTVAVRAARLDEEGRLAIFLMVPALGHILFLGLVSHGEPRFVFFPVALLATGAAVAADDLAQRLSPVGYRIGVWSMVIAIVGMLGISGSRYDRNAEGRAASTQILIDTAHAVVEDSGGAGSCEIATSYDPQLTWYSECLTRSFNAYEQSGPTRQHSYLVLFENGKRQPTGQELDQLLALTEGEPIHLVDKANRIGDATIWRVAG